MLGVLGLMGVTGGWRVDGRVGSLLLFCVALGEVVLLTLSKYLALCESIREVMMSTCHSISSEHGYMSLNEVASRQSVSLLMPISLWLTSSSFRKIRRDKMSQTRQMARCGGVGQGVR